MEKVYVILGNSSSPYEFEIDETVTIGAIKFSKKNHKSLYDFAEEKIVGSKSNNLIKVSTETETHSFTKDSLICIRKTNNK